MHKNYNFQRFAVSPRINSDNNMQSATASCNLHVLSHEYLTLLLCINTTILLLILVEFSSSAVCCVV